MIESTRIYVALLILLFSLNVGFGQNRPNLEKERNKIIEEIELTSKSLQKTKSDKKSTLADLKAIENQIKSRKKLIKNTQEQLKNADYAIDVNNKKIDSLNAALAGIQESYQKLARVMYAKELAGNKWAYIFSSQSINEAMLRWRYSKQYQAYVERKTQQVAELKGSINNKVNTISEEKAYIQKLLEDEKKNQAQLEKDQKKKDEILQSLKDEESSLRKDLAQKQSQREKLNKEIEKIILAELALKEKNKNKSNTAAILKPGGLLWPAKGYISGKFGNHKHPTLKNVTINNNGIDITSKPGAPVTSVADGTVIGITSIPGHDDMVIIQHGKFYSVYSRLDKVSVVKDTNIKAGHLIGYLANESSPHLHFEFWKEKTKLDPQKWLKN